MNFSGVSDRSVLGRAVRMPLRLIPKEARVRIVQGRLRGRKWIVGAGNHGCWLGSYENHIQQAFGTHIRSGDVVYDLGANVGFYSLLASQLVGPEGWVYSFEPVPRNLGYLRKHLEINQMANCTVFDAAVSSSEGTSHWDFGASHTHGKLTDTAGGFSVQMVQLDRLIETEGLRPPNVIKCDIEGGEFDALSGARATLARYLPKIFLATHGPEVHASCCRLLTGLGYRLTPLDGAPLEDSAELFAAPAEINESDELSRRRPTPLELLLQR